MKRCSKCGQKKPRTEFAKHRGRKDGLQDMCRACHSKSHLHYRYGITAEEKQDIFEAQDGCCRVCGDKFSSIKEACVEHDHEFLNIRGLVHDECNLALSMRERFPDRWPMMIAGADAYVRECRRTTIP